MKKTLFAVAAALLLTLPAACIHGPYGHNGGPGGPCCAKRANCDCKCRQGQEARKPCPDRPDCPKSQQAPAPCPNCPQHQPAQQK